LRPKTDFTQPKKTLTLLGVRVFLLLQVLLLLLYLGGDYLQSSLAYSLTGFSREVQFIFNILLFYYFIILLFYYF
jgi:hypothetical protein